MLDFFYFNKIFGRNLYFSIFTRCSKNFYTLKFSYYLTVYFPFVRPSETKLVSWTKNFQGMSIYPNQGANNTNLASKKFLPSTIPSKIEIRISRLQISTNFNKFLQKLQIFTKMSIFIGQEYAFFRPRMKNLYFFVKICSFL